MIEIAASVITTMFAMYGGWCLGENITQYRLRKKYPPTPTVKLPSTLMYEVVRKYFEKHLEFLKLEHEAGTVNLGAVNLADMSLTEVAWVVPEDGEQPYWSFTVEEASPECNIPKLMYERFIIPEAYVVRTEW